MSSLYHGIFTPLVTPILPDESPDLNSLDRLIEFQLQSGVHGFWAMGTSGEFASFDEDERASIIEATVRTADGRVPVIANVSGASTRMARRNAIRAVRAGADAIAATPPYYYPHSQDELLQHYHALHAEVGLPLYIYNIPQTVRVRLDLRTAQELIVDGSVAGIKDSQNDLEWLRQLAVFARRQSADFHVFAGTRFLIDAAVLAGADGAIPSIANAFPELCLRAYDAAVSGDFSSSRDAEAKIIALESVAAQIALGSRNAAILGFLKTVLQKRGLISHAGLTVPLRSPVSEEAEGIWRAVEAVTGVPVS